MERDETSDYETSDAETCGVETGDEGTSRSHQLCIQQFEYEVS